MRKSEVFVEPPLLLMQAACHRLTLITLWGMAIPPTGNLQTYVSDNGGGYAWVWTLSDGRVYGLKTDPHRLQFLGYDGLVVVSGFIGVSRQRPGLN